MMSDPKQIIDYYVDTQSKKLALEYLLIESGIIPENQNITDIFPIRERSDTKNLLKDAKKLVELTQSYFTVRKGNQERWQISPNLPWITETNEKEVRLAANTLGFEQDILPGKLSSRSGIILCVLGATLPAMEVRINYLKRLLSGKILESSKISDLVLLAGERPVTVNVDASQEHLQDIAEKFNVSLSVLTETHLIRHVFNESNIMELLRGVKISVIDTPAGNLPRPTTATTIVELIKWLKSRNNENGSKHKIIFVSNQPYTLYQQAVIANLFTEADLNHHVEFQVIGSAASHYMATYKIIGSLGSAIWAKTVQISKDILTVNNNSF